MDTLREDDREINHHGKPRDVGEDNKEDSAMTPVENTVKVAPADLRHRREDREVEARKNFYKQIKQAKKNKDRLIRCKRIGRIEIPTIIFIFVLLYWFYGLRNMS